MDSVEVEVPVASWRSHIPYVVETLRNTTRWALACPRPKMKANPFFFGAQDEPEIESSWFSIFAESITTTIVTILTAAVLLYVIDYFVQFCYSLGIVLSGNDVITPTNSRPGSPNHSAPSSPPPEPRDGIPRRIVKMNEPKNCAVRRAPTTISIRTSSGESTNSKSSGSSSTTVSSSSTTASSSFSSTKATGSESSKKTTSSDSSNSTSAPEPRLPAASDAVVHDESLLDFDSDIPVATVFGGPREDGVLETVGSFELEKPGKVFFIWMQKDANVSVTGSFFGYNLSVPLQKEANWCSFEMTIPIGRYEYEFVVEGQSSSEDIHSE